MIGIQKAFELITQGKELTAAKAKEMGIVNDIAETRDELLAKRANGVWTTPRPSSLGTRRASASPVATARAPAWYRCWPLRLHGQCQGARQLPGADPHHVFHLRRGLLDFDAACQVESRFFAACVTSQVSKNIINTLWYQLNAIKKGQSRPKDQPQGKVKKVGILGAGMMGAGIAYVSAKVGIDVVLLDTTQENADKGKAYSQGLLDKAVARGRSTVEKRDQLLARIQTTTSYEDLAGCDLGSKRCLKTVPSRPNAPRRPRPSLPGCGVRLEHVDAAHHRAGHGEPAPANFIGLHFFSPVDKMPLVEIIVGEKTSDETLARGFDYVLQIGKTPIVVNDKRGFYTSRVFATYVMEGLAMLSEGVHPVRSKWLA